MSSSRDSFHISRINNPSTDLDYLTAFHPIGSRDVISGIAPHVYDPHSPEGRKIARRMSRSRRRRSKRPSSMPTPRPSPLREFVVGDDGEIVGQYLFLVAQPRVN